MAKLRQRMKSAAKKLTRALASLFRRDSPIQDDQTKNDEGIDKAEGEGVKKKRSRFFRNSLTPSNNNDSNSPSRSPSEHAINISRPSLVSQRSDVIASEPIFSKDGPITKRAGPPPQRPPRPASLDQETIQFMQENSGPVVMLCNSHHSSAESAASTATRSTTEQSGPTNGRASAESRLGLFRGHTAPASASNPLTEPLAANVSHTSLLRESTGNQYMLRYSQEANGGEGAYVYGDAGDGLDRENREVGPIEQYRANMEGRWVEVQRVRPGETGADGRARPPGTLYRDESGSFHWVADI